MKERGVTLHFANYDEYKQWWKENHSGLSKEEQDKRKPINYFLEETSNEPIHKEVGKNRLAKVVRVSIDD